MYIICDCSFVFVPETVKECSWITDWIQTGIMDS